jgi:hypothetical protein
MVEPLRPKDIQRIVRQARTRTRSAEADLQADLEEHDRLLTEEIDRDPSIELSPEEKKAKRARGRRMKLLARRLFKDSG